MFNFPGVSKDTSEEAGIGFVDTGLSIVMELENLQDTDKSKITFRWTDIKMEDIKDVSQPNIESTMPFIIEYEIRMVAESSNLGSSVYV